MLNQIIHLDGLDKSGKSSLLKHIVKESKGRYLVHDRSFISQIAYGRIFKRDINEEYFWNKFETHSMLNEKFVYLECNADVMIKRIKDNSETDIGVLDIVPHKKVFEEVIRIAKENQNINVIRINNTFQTISQTYSELQSKL